MSHTVSTDRMNDLPILSVAVGIRNPYLSANLLPGAGQVNTGANFVSAMRVNGMPGDTLALRVEGQDATQNTWTSAAAMSQPGADSIQETTIQTSNFPAEYMQAGGGVFNMTMKSGTITLAVSKRASSLPASISNHFRSPRISRTQFVKFVVFFLGMRILKPEAFSCSL